MNEFGLAECLIILAIIIILIGPSRLARAGRPFSELVRHFRRMVRGKGDSSHSEERRT